MKVGVCSDGQVELVAVGGAGGIVECDRGVDEVAGTIVAAGARPDAGRNVMASSTRNAKKPVVAATWGCWIDAIFFWFSMERAAGSRGEWASERQREMRARA